MDPVRLDRLLVDRGLVASRPRAERLITDHGVRVDGIEVRKPGKKVSPDAQLDLLGEDLPWVSRGALKLVAALDHYALNPSERVVLDLGASTGGFTEVCLHRGARFVHAVDVGTNQLVPALRQAGLVVEVQTGWVDDLVDLFNRSTVYLYDSAEYWRGRGVTEGFGLPPLEALACGCVVFSSLNHALADYGDPGHTVHQIGCGRLGFDLERIKAAVATPQHWRPADDRLEVLLQECSEAALLERWRDTFVHLDALEAVSGPPLSSPPTWRLRLNQLAARLQRVVKRLPGWPSP